MQLSLPMRLFIPVACIALLSSTAHAQRSNPPAADTRPAHEVFWSALQSLCGQAFAGTVTESVPPDTSFEKAALRMHVRECSADTVRIPFHVGANRSRTWVLTRVRDGLRLKHDHRHEDGSADSVTQYGGDTRYPGLATHMQFHADSFTAGLIPAARANIWILELVPGERFVYALRRAGSDRRFRAEFDLSRPVPPPPPPWGATRPRELLPRERHR